MTSVGQEDRQNLDALDIDCKTLKLTYLSNDVIYNASPRQADRQIMYTNIWEGIAHSGLTDMDQSTEVVSLLAGEFRDQVCISKVHE